MINFLHHIHNISVCVHVYMNISKNENNTEHFDREWTLGSCFGPKMGMKYSSNEV